MTTLALCWPDRSWDPAIEAARAAVPAGRWRQGLAEALAPVPGVHHALVFTCPRSRPDRGRFTLSDERLRPLHERIQSDFTPRVQRLGLGFPALLRRHGRVATLVERIKDQPVARALHRDVLAPAGIRDCVTVYLTTPREELAGWLVLALTAPPGPFVAEHRGSLERLADVATEARGVLRAVLTAA